MTSAAELAIIKEIEDYKKAVDRLEDRTTVDKLTPNIYSPKDVVGVWRVDGNIIRITTSFFPENGETRSYYFVRNNKIVYLKHREWYPEIESPYAKEFIAYFDEGKAINVQERSVNLKKNERPQKLLKAILKDSPMNRDSLAQAVDQTLEEVKRKAGIK